jgi:Protein of unknown function (DUF1566)
VHYSRIECVVRRSERCDLYFRTASEYALRSSESQSVSLSSLSTMKSSFEGIRRFASYTCPIIAVLLSSSTLAVNDTGTTLCYTNSQFSTACTAAVISDTGTHPRQDARLGRDANPSPGKIGAGAAGFDFTKISGSGNALPASAAFGPGANDWACTRDNVTGLIWEVKTSNPSNPGLRDVLNTYTWYNSDPASNGGDAGSTGNTTSCNGTLAACNTQEYLAAINAANMCGRNDWRLPSYKDAFTIFNAQALGNATPTPFDPTFFLMRGTAMFTSNTVIPVPNSVFYVDGGGMTFTSKSSLARQVRVVAGTNAYQ